MTRTAPVVVHRMWTIYSCKYTHTEFCFIFILSFLLATVFRSSHCLLLSSRGTASVCSCILNLFIFILYLEEFYDGMKNPVNKPNEDRMHMETKFSAETLPSSIPLSATVSRADHNSIFISKATATIFNKFSTIFICNLLSALVRRWEISEKNVSNAVNRK